MYVYNLHITKIYAVHIHIYIINDNLPTFLLIYLVEKLLVHIMCDFM